jgi:hypothetical protein
VLSLLTGPSYQDESFWADSQYQLKRYWTRTAIICQLGRLPGLRNSAVTNILAKPSLFQLIILTNGLQYLTLQTSSFTSYRFTSYFCKTYFNSIILSSTCRSSKLSLPTLFSTNIIYIFTSAILMYVAYPSFNPY